MKGWVIVYFPGGDVYDMFDDTAIKSSFRSRLVRKGIKTFLVVVQLYWWIKT